VLKSIRMRWVGHIACMEESKGAYSALGAKTKGKRPLGGARH